MRRLHLIAGLTTIVAFAVTGQIMAHHQPPLSTLPPETRLMFRSRHIYVLAGGLVNTMLGVYVRLQRPGWRRRVQILGSALLILAPVLLVAAFAMETAHPFREELPLSQLGVVFLALGSLAHFVSGMFRTSGE
jgi:hypothetical protein